ncbi:MAG: B12-binding domain-containing radical SAM protein [Clostridia bacterium]|nr:B12-binding domain-containing radical SAM protein [Clostridia bacterium]
MRFLFFFPSTGYYNRAISNPLGLLAIGSFLKKNGHEVKIADRNIERIDLKKLFDSFRPDAVGISVMSARGIKDALKISRIGKENGVPVVWGGQMSSMQPELSLSSEYVDFVSYGEGEYTWLEIAEALEKKTPLTDIRGLIYLDGNGELVFTGERPFADLAEFGRLDFSLLQMEKYAQRYLGCKKMVYLYSAKGCPGNCAFCANTKFHKSTFRKRPTGYVVAEMKELSEKYGIDGIYFSDEVFCLKRSDVVEFCETLKRENIDVQFGIQLRIGICREEELQLLYDSGCRWALFGVETGNKEMQKRIHKHINYDIVRQTIEITDRIGITPVATFIVGYPGETEEQIRDTVHMINSLKTSLIPLSLFTPLPGTEFYNEVVASGAYTPPKDLRELSRLIATESVGQNLSAVPSRDLRVIKSWFTWKAFTDKQAVKSDKKFEFAIDTIVSGLSSISMKGVISFFVNGFAAMREFTSVFMYSHFFPSVIRKYDLNVETKEQEGS